MLGVLKSLAGLIRSVPRYDAAIEGQALRTINMASS
jgi:hypothetical protein